MSGNPRSGSGRSRSMSTIGPELDVGVGLGDVGSGSEVGDGESGAGSPEVGDGDPWSGELAVGDGDSGSGEDDDSGSSSSGVVKVGEGRGRTLPPRSACFAARSDADADADGRGADDWLGPTVSPGVTIPGWAEFGVRDVPSPNEGTPAPRDRLASAGASTVPAAVGDCPCGRKRNQPAPAAATPTLSTPAAAAAIGRARRGVCRDCRPSSGWRCGAAGWYRLGWLAWRRWRREARWRPGRDRAVSSLNEPPLVGDVSGSIGTPGARGDWTDLPHR
jgi:hypothetical protein